MKMKERNNGDVVVMSLAGDVMNDDALDRFVDRVHTLKDEGQNKVVLDLGGVRLINSGGVGMLVGAMISLRNVGGDMKLANLSDRAETILLVIAQLSRVFDIYATVEGAVSSFRVSQKTV